MIDAGALLALLFTVAVVWFLIAPHLRGTSTALLQAASGGELSEQKRALLQVLKDLEHDFSTGKLSDADYQEMRAGVRGELAAVLKRLAS